MLLRGDGLALPPCGAAAPRRGRGAAPVRVVPYERRARGADGGRGVLAACTRPQRKPTVARTGQHKKPPPAMASRHRTSHPESAVVQTPSPTRTKPVPAVSTRAEPGPPAAVAAAAPLAMPAVAAAGAVGDGGGPPRRRAGPPAPPRRPAGRGRPPAAAAAAAAAATPPHPHTAPLACRRKRTGRASMLLAVYLVALGAAAAAPSRSIEPLVGCAPHPLPQQVWASRRRPVVAANTDTRGPPSAHGATTPSPYPMGARPGTDGAVYTCRGRARDGSRAEPNKNGGAGGARRHPQPVYFR